MTNVLIMYATDTYIFTELLFKSIIVCALPKWLNLTNMRICM